MRVARHGTLPPGRGTAAPALRSAVTRSWAMPNLAGTALITAQRTLRGRSVLLESIGRIRSSGIVSLGGSLLVPSSKLAVDRGPCLPPPGSFSLSSCDSGMQRIPLLPLMLQQAASNKQQAAGGGTYSAHAMPIFKGKTQLQGQGIDERGQTPVLLSSSSVP